MMTCRFPVGRLECAVVSDGQTEPPPEPAFPRLWPGRRTPGRQAPQPTRRGRIPATRAGRRGIHPPPPGSLPWRGPGRETGVSAGARPGPRGRDCVLVCPHPAGARPGTTIPGRPRSAAAGSSIKPSRRICSCTRTSCPFLASAGSGASMARTCGCRRRREPEPEPASSQRPAAGVDCPHICFRFKLNGPGIVTGIRGSYVLRVSRSAECHTGE